MTSGHAVSAKLSLTSPDGDEGYPGTLHVIVTYTLSDDNALTITYDANQDDTTVVFNAWPEGFQDIGIGNRTGATGARGQ